jgi:uncharacterized protein YjbI with pentapeptide repeats
VGRKKRGFKQEPSNKDSLWWKRLWGWTQFGKKTGWDWLQLLIVPLALAVVGFLFTMQQDARQQKIENQRAAAERELAEQRAQNEALQAYLDQMSTLLLEKDLRNSEEDSEVRTLARARTATVIQRLDADGNRNVIRFLNEANLTGSIRGRSSISLLAQADLRGAHFEGVDLSAIDLSGAILSGANLSDADLSGANLSGADLSNAFLSLANLYDADLRGANLSDANLSSALLYYADLRGVDLIGADLSGAILSGANLSGAFLAEADLRDAVLYDKNTRDATANLTGADLTGADLEGAIGFKEQLTKAKSLKGATMPNGQKYEDWLKSKEGHGEPG